LRLVDASIGRGAGMRGAEARYGPPSHLVGFGAMLRCDGAPYVPPSHLVGSGAALRCDDAPYLPPVHVAAWLRLVDATVGSGATVSSEDAFWVVAADGMDWSPLSIPEFSVSSSSCIIASRDLSGSSSVALVIAIRSWNNSAGEY
jgi:hypothetical protein